MARRYPGIFETVRPATGIRPRGRRSGTVARTPLDKYTHGHQDAVLRSHRWRTASNSAAYLLPALQPGQRLLDVGCGPGTLTVDLALHVAPGQVVAVDTAASVISEARHHAARENVENVSFIAADFRHAKLPDRSFDVVHAHQVLQHLRDPVAALAAMSSLARRGGIVAARDSDYAGFLWWPKERRLERWLEVYQTVARGNGAEPDAGRRLLDWAQRAGLSEVTYSTSTWTFATPEDRRWWADLWAERCTHSSFAEQAVAYGVATHDGLGDLATGWRTWSQADAGVFVVPHGEILCRVSGTAPATPA